MHGGLRTKLFVCNHSGQLCQVHANLYCLQGPKDYVIDKNVGFSIIEAHEIDDIGMSGVIEKTRKVVKDTPTYLSIDIDGKTNRDSWKRD